MTDSEPVKYEREPVARSIQLGVATWRYVGSRSDADLAYCARFGTDEAPEPTVALGCAWAYALPGTQPR